MCLFSSINIQQCIWYIVRLMLLCLLFTFAEGHLVADAVTAQRSSTSSFISAPLLLTAPRCLTLSYQITGGSNTSVSELRVSVLSPFVRQSRPVWRMARQQQSYQTARVTLTPSSQPVVQLSLDVLYGGDNSVKIYLDSVSVTNGACSVPGMILY